MSELLADEAVSPEMSTLALQRKFHGTRKYETNPSNSYKELTEVVLQYKQKSTTQGMQQILRLTEKLIFTVMRQYGMFTFPESVTEDVFADCQTFVLLKCLDTYDPARKASFCTHYTWWLKSYMNYKYDYHHRRQGLYNATSLTPIGDPGFDGGNDHDRNMDIPTFHHTTMSRVKRLVAENFK